MKYGLCYKKNWHDNLEMDTHKQTTGLKHFFFRNLDLCAIDAYDANNLNNRIALLRVFDSLLKSPNVQFVWRN